MNSLASYIDAGNDQVDNVCPDDDLPDAPTHDRDLPQMGNTEKGHRRNRVADGDAEHIQRVRAQHIEQRRLIDNELGPINDRLSSLVSQIQDLNKNFEGRLNIVENDNIVASWAIEHLQNGQRQPTGHIRQLTEANEHQ
ncbi:hypothetical protein QAD02_002751 [Eretmocerus hayati]|uniref:Uncharacterized protein n=1 Tax=Eretmocerus hayati TaxID=131215 RepID=A0ACC2NK64_9HYME|nr:hypothetical protein QAD02_002751 [Eretmocerus hayati]